MTWVAIIAGLIVLVLLALRAVAIVKQAGIDAEKGREAEARARDLERIKAAAAARPIGGVSDDPHNLDR